MGKSKKEDILEDYRQEKQKLLKKYNIVEKPTLEFPRYREYPEDLRLALVVIQGHKPSFSISIYEKEDKK